eukprot:363931-Chlamydomonas_euryale.AAC.10
MRPRMHASTAARIHPCSVIYGCADVGYGMVGGWYIHPPGDTSTPADMCTDAPPADMCTDAPPADTVHSRHLRY